jgi:hypothetical protein
MVYIIKNGELEVTKKIKNEERKEIDMVKLLGPPIINNENKKKKKKDKKTSDEDEKPKPIVIASTVSDNKRK